MGGAAENRHNRDVQFMCGKYSEWTVAAGLTACSGLLAGNGWPAELPPTSRELGSECHWAPFSSSCHTKASLTVLPTAGLRRRAAVHSRSLH
jgi:hypothetical protein